MGAKRPARIEARALRLVPRVSGAPAARTSPIGPSPPSGPAAFIERAREAESFLFDSAPPILVAFRARPLYVELWLAPKEPWRPALD